MSVYIFYFYDLKNNLNCPPSVPPVPPEPIFDLEWVKISGTAAGLLDQTTLVSGDVLNKLYVQLESENQAEDSNVVLPSAADVISYKNTLSPALNQKVYKFIAVNLSNKRIKFSAGVSGTNTLTGLGDWIPSGDFVIIKVEITSETASIKTITYTKIASGILNSS